MNALHSPTITIRAAYTDDARALLRLAALDDSRPLSGDMLVAEVDGELVAAHSLLDGRSIADPFRRTAELVDLLRTHAAAGREQARSRRTPRFRRIAPVPAH